MSFKLTLFGIEFGSSRTNAACDCSKINTEEYKMAKKKSKKKLTPQQKKFKSAQTSCHRETTTPKQFGKCMSEKLTKKKTKRKK